AARAAVTLCYEPGFVTVSVTDTRRDRDTVPVVNGTVNRAANGPVSGSPVNGTPVLGAPGRGTPGAGPAGDQPGLVQSGGFGLAGIAERVASCGGRLSVGPTDAGGFAVSARLPAQ
ncbi:MAG: hypothetical protein QOG05_5964, partial [Streptosporangiaceae bacterium]|nr:hypothetical protein [Streptosporangiaceae bacterium]